MDRDELMKQLRIAVNGREEWRQKLEEASHNLNEMDRNVDGIIDQLQPRIEVTKPLPTFEETAINFPPPSERVHDALLHAGRRLTTDEIVHITGLGRKQVGPCLGVLVKGGRIRNVGNGTWAAA